MDNALELTSEAGGEPRVYKTVGTRPVRHDGVEKVTGQAQYGADISLPGMLYGKVLRSPHAHARVLSIDTSRAEAHPDVRAVATAADLVSIDGLPADSAEARSLKLVRDNVLASDKVLYVGHAVAAVAAASPHVAEEALSLIDIDYEVLPHVTTVEAAMAPDAPALHDHLDPAAHGGPNVSVHEQHKWGDLEAGFAEADRVVEREFSTKTVHQGYVEPQNGTASWPPDGRLTIWCSSQGHFGIRDGAAKVLGLPVSEIKVVPMEIGGGFGGKLKVYLEPLAAVLSRKSGHPVQLTMTRSEVLEATGPTSGSLVRIRMGVTNEGRITAAQCYFAFEAGAFPGAAPIQAAAAAILAPYDIDNILVDAYEVVDNKPMTSAYRAPGAPIVVYAVESVIDEMAEAVGIDPIELRLLNVAEEGSRRGRWRDERTHRGPRDDGGREVASPLLGAAERRVHGPRRRHGLLPQQHGPVHGRRPRPRQWHREPGRGLRGHRRLPHGRGPAVRGGPGHTGLRRHAQHRRHRRDRLHLQHGRQRRRLQDRVRRVRGGERHRPTARRARRAGLGRAGGRDRVRGRRSAAQVRS